MLAPDTVSTTTPVIREMDKVDIPAMCDMAARVWRAHYVPEVVTAEQIEYMLPMLYTPEIIIQNIREKQQRFWLTENDGNLTGYIAVEPLKDSSWFIDKLYVEMDIQRNGLGSTLLNHAIKTLKPRTLMLRVNKRNYKAINFYFRHGFVIDSLHTLDIGGGFVMDDFIMKKVL